MQGRGGLSISTVSFSNWSCCYLTDAGLALMTPPGVCTFCGHALQLSAWGVPTILPPSTVVRERKKKKTDFDTFGIPY